MAKNKKIAKTDSPEIQSEENKANSPKVSEETSSNKVQESQVKSDKKTTSLAKRTKKKIEDRELPALLSAWNTQNPKIYKVLSIGRSHVEAFPRSMDKAYYVGCLGKIVPHFPIEILAYSLTNTRVYLILGSYDQTLESLNRFILEVNNLYSQYYNQVFKGAGYVFSSDIKVSLVNTPEEVAASVAIVHSQPSAANLCESFSYPYCSYGPNSLVSFRPLDIMTGSRNKSLKLLHNAHKKGPRLLPSKYFTFARRDSLSTVYDNVLIDYGYYHKNTAPNNVMHSVIAEMNDRGAFSFDQIVRKVGLNKEEKYDMLVKTIVELALRKNQSFDESIANLDILFKTSKSKISLIKDVFFIISNRTGYAYDFIMNLLGFAYPNYEFLVDMIKYISFMRGISIEAAIKRLGIIENVEYVLGLCS